MDPSYGVRDSSDTAHRGGQEASLFVIVLQLQARAQAVLGGALRGLGGWVLGRVAGRFPVGPINIGSRDVVGEHRQHGCMSIRLHESYSLPRRALVTPFQSLTAILDIGVVFSTSRDFA